MSIFARVGTIKGESVDAAHRDEIEVLSWSWGVSRAGGPGHGGSGGAGAGRATVDDLVFTHRVDRASPLLMNACATGEHLRDATIAARRAGAGQQDHLVVTLREVRVTSVSTSVGAEDDSTLEVVALAFGKVEVEYRPQRADGALDARVHFVHDVRAHTHT